jgi:hypothetical protein
MKLVMDVSKSERTMMVAALVAYGAPELAWQVLRASYQDTADDGPEVKILMPRKVSSFAKNT